MQRNLLFLVFVSILAQFSVSHAELIQIQGQKFPNSLNEGTLPVLSSALAPSNPEDLGGFNELLAYVTPSPDQEEAGTCLFMSLTGVAEWWLRRLNNVTEFHPDDDYDLSERWWINNSLWLEHTKRIENWNTDTIYMFNSTHSVLNRDYRFTKGWYLDSENGIKPTKPNAKGAVYDTGYNWFDASDRVKPSTKIKLPKFSRKVLYEDPEENPWAIGKAPADIVDQVRTALAEQKAPVQVIYNHQGYWHSVYVIGFDDEADIGECPFIKESLSELQKESEKSLTEAETAPNKEEKAKLKARSKRMLRYKKEINASLAKTKGCTNKGVFYVRDSQYSDPSEPLYRYDLKNPSADKPYSKRIILREYDWLTHLANNVVVITAKSSSAQISSL